MKRSTYNWEHRIEMEFKRMKGDFTRTDKKDALSKEANLSKRDLELVKQFVDECRAEGLSSARIEYYMRVLRMTKRFIHKDFDKVEKKDMKKFMADLEQTNFSPWTKQGYKIGMKKFYRWLHTEVLGHKLKRKEYPEVVEWINTTLKESDTKLPENMLNEDDVTLLIKHCLNVRDKALIAVLWDSGCRVGELLTLKLKHLTFDKFGATITVSGKTGSRRVRLTPSVPYLANWKENHPLNDNPEAPLWVNIGTKNNHKAVTYSGLDNMLRSLKKRAHMKKKMNPHAFRHARATFFAPKVTEAVMKETFGWKQKSQMVGTYVHLSGREVDKEIRIAQGLETDEEEIQKSKLIPKECIRCRQKNEATSNFCKYCGMGLSQEALQELDQTKKISETIQPQKMTLDKNVMKEVIREMIKNGEISLFGK